MTLIKKNTRTLLMLLSILIALPNHVFGMSDDQTTKKTLLLAQGATVATCCLMGIGIGVSLYKNYSKKKHDAAKKDTGKKEKSTSLLTYLSGIVGGAMGTLIGTVYALALSKQIYEPHNSTHVHTQNTDYQDMNDTVNNQDNINLPQEPFTCNASNCSKNESQAITLSCGHRICFDCAAKRAERNINKCVENVECKGIIPSDLYTALFKQPSTMPQNTSQHTAQHQNQPSTTTPRPRQEELGCTICYEEKAENPFTLTGCKHSFCRNCIKKWLNTKDVFGAKYTNCPNCRTDVSFSDRLTLA